MRLPLVSLALLFSCSDLQPRRQFNGEQGLRYVEQQMAFGPRIPGTAAHQRMAQWLDSLLHAKADTVVVQTWLHVTLKGDTLELRNFVARFNRAATNRVLYLAHWDTRPASGPDSALDRSKPVSGANDGGSGVAVLLGVADALKATAPGIGVDLLFVDGEDYGVFSDGANGGQYGPDVLIGSTWYAAHQPAGPTPLFAILWDMVGDKDLQLHPESYSNLAAPEVVDRVWSAAEELNYGQYFNRTLRHTLIDDHVSLQKVGISAIDVVDFDYPYWHTPEDTLDKVSAESLKIVGDVALWVIRRTR